MEKSVIIFILIFLGLLVVVPTLGLSISSYIIGSKFVDVTCASSGRDIIPLSSWLFINATCSIVFTTIYVTILLMFIAKQEFKFMIIFIVIYILNWLFVLVWNIIGAVQLFEHSAECINSAKPLWIMSLSCLIFQWVSIFYTSIVKCCYLKRSE